MATLARLDLVDTVTLSVIIPVTARSDNSEQVYHAYAARLRGAGHTVEFIYVLDGEQPLVSAALGRLVRAGEPVQIVRFNREFGEAACLREGVRRAIGQNILFLPAYLQVEPDAIVSVVAGLQDADVVSAYRNRHSDRAFNRMRGWWFEQFARIAGSRFDDPGCVVRAARRRVFDEVPIQDEQQRFLPLMAELHGFRVNQIEVAQAGSDYLRRQHRPGVYLAVLLDLLAVSFLLRFVQKPFRFFGSLGAMAILASLILGVVLLFERQISHVPLGERPMLVLVVLLMVLGIQIAAIGLIAEIVIFMRSDGRAHYHIDTIIEHSRDDG